MLKPLTAELDRRDSPVRRFLDERFTGGLREVQRRYRQAAPPLMVASADRAEANPATVGTAADWLLRFMLHPRPSLALAAAGAARFGPGSGMAEALIEIAEWLGYDPEAVLDRSATDFTGPTGGSDAGPGQLIGYALLDFDDAYQLTEAGIFSARYGYLATWDIGALLDELAGDRVDLAAVRREFRQLLRRA